MFLFVCLSFNTTSKSLVQQRLLIGCSWVSRPLIGHYSPAASLRLVTAAWNMSALLPRSSHTTSTLSPACTLSNILPRNGELENQGFFLVSRYHWFMSFLTSQAPPPNPLLLTDNTEMILLREFYVNRKQAAADKISEMSSSYFHISQLYEKQQKSFLH